MHKLRKKYQLLELNIQTKKIKSYYRKFFAEKGMFRTTYFKNAIYFNFKISYFLSFKKSTKHALL